MTRRLNKNIKHQKLIEITCGECEEETFISVYELLEDAVIEAIGMGWRRKVGATIICPTCAGAKGESK